MDGRGKRQNLGSREGEKKVNRKSSRWEKGRRGEGEEERKKKRDEGEEDGDVKELKKLEWWCFALSGENPSMKICLFFFGGLQLHLSIFYSSFYSILPGSVYIFSTYQPGISLSAPGALQIAYSPPLPARAA